MTGCTYLNLHFFFVELSLGVVDAEMGHTPASANTPDIAHELDCTENVVNQRIRQANQLDRFDTRFLPGRLLNTSRDIDP